MTNCHILTTIAATTAKLLSKSKLPFHFQLGFRKWEGFYDMHCELQKAIVV
jgi:hypothetical protein